MRISDWSSDVCSSDLVLSESKGGIEGWPVQGLPGRRPARPRNWRCRRQPSSAIPIFSLKFVKSLLTLCGKIPIYTNGLGELTSDSLHWHGSLRGSSKVLTLLSDFLCLVTGARAQTEG